MADATESRELLSRNLQLRMTRKLTVAAATTIYAGQIVGIDAFGEAVHATTTLKVAGIAVSDAVAGDVLTCWLGYVVKLPYSLAAVTDVGLTAYAVDSSLATNASNTAILGPIIDWESGYIWVLLTLRA